MINDNAATRRVSDECTSIDGDNFLTLRVLASEPFVDKSLNAIPNYLNKII